MKRIGELKEQKMMKKCLCMGLVLLLAGSAWGAEVKNVTAVQRWPWNGKVDIQFDLEEELPANAMIVVTAEDQTSETSCTASMDSLSGDTGRGEGPHHVIWDLDAQGLSLQSSNVIFTVAYYPVQYCVVDLSGGASATTYPVTYLSEPPSEGFNTDEYKTTKLVLRWIEPGTFKMGGSYQTTLTQPYYIGIFELTQKQYQLVTGSNPSQYKGDKRPLENVSWNTMRGNTNWPASPAVSANSFMGRLRARTGLHFDLPTEAQWEYACRAGTTTAYSYGGSANGNYMWYWDNSSDQSHEVGTKRPNAWGLYDMHGNEWEWCLDWAGDLVNGVTDPVGLSSGSGRVDRGGGWHTVAESCTSSSRGRTNPEREAPYTGFRLVRLPSEEEK